MGRPKSGQNNEASCLFYSLEREEYSFCCAGGGGGGGNCPFFGTLRAFRLLTDVEEKNLKISLNCLLKSLFLLHYDRTGGQRRAYRFLLCSSLSIKCPSRVSVDCY